MIKLRKVVQHVRKKCETVHQTLHRHENVHGYPTVRKMGTPVHVQRSNDTLTTFNSKRAGFSPAFEMTLRRTALKFSPMPMNL